VAVFAGLVESTVGLVVSGAAAVVNVQMKLLASAVSVRSMAPVVIVAVYTVLDARLAAGVKVATEPAATYVTAPITATPPGPVTAKVIGLIVAGFIATLKVAVRAWLMGTPVAPLAGMVKMTVGGVAAGTDLKLHTKLLASALPARSIAPVVIVAVSTVLSGSRAAGVNVATVLVQLTVPATAVAPGPVTVKVVAGDWRVAQFIALLNDALSVVLGGTPVAP
jgi:hypothetical protein